ncbi:membrane protein [Mycobacterium antarcticum]|uniref:phage holin family protein n=1 Tax=Mycolicibacterium sp. TUM20983 TaxID=3023369 RepID=UPI0023A502EE|nr:phage holin family protein [Mycolicibacterium sp. TUM20983]GLP77976.1 membrane protein [Mycolicibacterium sp. TUM20983]
MSVGSTPTENASTGELITQLTAQTSRLVRDEIRLAQKEFQESAKHAGIGAGLFSVAGVFAVFGVATLIAAAVAGLALVLPVWAAALIVGVVLLAAGGIAALSGKRQIQEASPVPEQTVANVKEDIQEVRDARHDRT